MEKEVSESSPERAALHSSGYFWMLLNPNRQTLHDKLAGTYVVMA